MTEQAWAKCPNCGNECRLPQICDNCLNRSQGLPTLVSDEVPVSVSIEPVTRETGLKPTKGGS